MWISKRVVWECDVQEWDTFICIYIFSNEFSLLCSQQRLHTRKELVLHAQ